MCFCHMQTQEEQIAALATVSYLVIWCHSDSSPHL